MRSVLRKIKAAATGVTRGLAPEVRADERATATRVSLSDEWQEQQQQVDWMAAPWIPLYVNGLVTGLQNVGDGHWANYARRRFLEPLREDLGRDFRMLSLACGSAHIEEFLIDTFRWPVGHFVGLEYDDALRADGERRLRQLAETPRGAELGLESELRFFDFNHPPRPESVYDLVFTCHSIHHASDVEAMLRFAHESLTPEGLFIGIDFFGPTRFQIEYDVLPLIEELYEILPTSLKRLPDGTVPERFEPPRLDEVIAADPSESPRSSDLRTLLFSNFEVVDVKPMGGTLLRWLLQYRAGNFDHANEEHVAISRLLQVIERELIELRKIRSDDLFFVLRRSNRLTSG